MTSSQITLLGAIAGVTIFFGDPWPSAICDEGTQVATPVGRTCLLCEEPIEAGLGWITKTDKGDFVGRAPIVKAKQGGVTRKLVGFALNDRAFPRQGYPINAGGSPTGSVTSGTFSPVLDRGIGMGYVALPRSKPGTALTVSIRNREIPAEVVQPPFIRK